MAESLAATVPGLLLLLLAPIVYRSSYRLERRWADRFDYTLIGNPPHLYTTILWVVFGGTSLFMGVTEGWVPAFAVLLIAPPVTVFTFMAGLIWGSTALLSAQRALQHPTVRWIYVIMTLVVLALWIWLWSQGRLT